MRYLRYALLGLVVVAVLLAGPAPVAQAATFTVDSTGDGGDFSTADGVCDTDDGVGDGPCTLRAAIEQANATGGTDTINFSIGTGVQTITPVSALPTISDPVTIDGTTQPGFTTTPIIELDGTSAGAGVDGLSITAGSTTVKGLVINRFGGSGIELSTNGGNVIEGNYIGTNLSGVSALANDVGVAIMSISNNVIGVSATSQRNVISGNTTYGVQITGAGAEGNQVKGNYIGLNAFGISPPVPNGDGILIEQGAQSNTVGGVTTSGSCDNDCNVISGNTTGVRVDGNGTDNNVVKGNFIGLNPGGDTPIGNFYGVRIAFNGQGNTIGGSTAAERNVISGNQFGIYIQLSHSNVVKGNFIGLNPAGDTRLANSVGVRIDADAQGNTIGGSTTGERNVISGNSGGGVQIDGVGTDNNMVKGNFIGTDVTGDNRIEGSSGVLVTSGADGTTIGGGLAGEGNVISGNSGAGIRIRGQSSDPIVGTVVKGNYIGTNAAGDAAIPNNSGSLPGALEINGNVQNTTVGGSTPSERNVISGNDQDGVFIAGIGSGNTISGNYIGTDAGGTAPLGNGGNGVTIFNGQGSTIGGMVAGDGNTIAYNAGDGVRVDGVAAAGDPIRGNSIHSNAGKGIETINGGNLELAPPIIDTVGSASGHTDPKCYPCTVEIFSDDEDEGRIYHGSATTNDDATGTWAYAGAVTGPNITATVTHIVGNTSEFSTPFVAGTCPTMPWPTPIGDDDCDGFTTADERIIFGVAPGSDEELTPCRTDTVVDPWPPDTFPAVTPDRLVDGQDQVAFLPALFKGFGQPGYSARLDIFEPGTVIDGQDLVVMLPFMFKSCQPPP